MLGSTPRAAWRLILTAMLVMQTGIGGGTLLYAQSGDDWYVGKPIADVRFDGLRHVAESDLRAIVRPYVDQVFTLDLFWELQGRLYATDLFESLESNAVAVDDQRSAVIVEFLVQERPLVGSVDLVGNQRVRDNELLEVMELSRGDVFDPIKLDADESAIRGLYVAKGYPDAAVTIDTARDDESGEVAVTVQVAEGFEVTVDEIRFVGNEFASESTLRGRIRTKKRSLFESGAFREVTLQEDEDIIESYYASHGYVDAEVIRIERELVADPDQQRRSLSLTIYVTEGQQYTYGGMSFAGNAIFSSEELNNLVRHGADREVNREVVEADFLRVQDLYYESGYIFNLFELIEERDEETRRIAYRVVIQERERAHIENIVISGADKTRDHVILRELPFEVGDVFNRTAIVQGLRNLYNTQYFSAVTPDTPPGSAEGLMDVVITVEEQSTADINFGVTIGGSEFPFAGTVRWNERNLFGGGQSIGAGTGAVAHQAVLEPRVCRTVVVRCALVRRFEPRLGALRGSQRAAGYPAAHLRRPRPGRARPLREQGRVGASARRRRVRGRPLHHGLHRVGRYRRYLHHLPHSHRARHRAVQRRLVIHPALPDLRHGDLPAVREDDSRRS